MGFAEEGGREIGSRRDVLEKWGRSRARDLKYGI